MSINTDGKSTLQIELENGWAKQRWGITLERIATALERIANHLDNTKQKSDRQKAHESAGDRRDWDECDRLEKEDEEV